MDQRRAEILRANAASTRRSS